MFGLMRGVRPLSAMSMNVAVSFLDLIGTGRVMGPRRCCLAAWPTSVGQTTTSVVAARSQIGALRSQFPWTVSATPGSHGGL